MDLTDLLSHPNVCQSAFSKLASTSKRCYMSHILRGSRVAIFSLMWNYDFHAFYDLCLHLFLPFLAEHLSVSGVITRKFQTYISFAHLDRLRACLRPWILETCREAANLLPRFCPEFLTEI